MIITLVVVGLLIVGIVLMNYADKHCDSSGVWFAGTMLTALMAIGIIVCGYGIIDTQISKDVAYQNAVYEREMLEYRIDNIEEDIVGNELLYNDIVEFNNNLRSVKKWANNPLTNWFYVKDIATIDYIKIDK